MLHIGLQYKLCLRMENLTAHRKNVVKLIVTSLFSARYPRLAPTQVYVVPIHAEQTINEIYKFL